MRLPSELLFEQCNNQSEAEYLLDLRRFRRELCSVNTAWRSKQKVFDRGDLKFYDKVFIHDDSVKPSLLAPYTGPRIVLIRLPKYFEVVIKENKVKVSIDRLKPVFMNTTYSSLGRACFGDTTNSIIFN